MTAFAHSRRDFLKTIGLGLATLALPGCLTAAQKVSSGSTDKPNIILIMADDLGYSDVGCFGGEVQTPNLNRLAAEGMRFRQFYNCAKCNPTRASLLTGQYDQAVGVANMEHGVTFAEVLRPAGYRTIISGKWHQNPLPTTRGFDRYWGLADGCCNFWNPGMEARPGEPAPGRKKRGARRWADEGKAIMGYVPEKKDFYTTDEFATYAIDRLEEYKDEGKPFLLYMPFTAPHYPLQAKKQDIEKYKNKYSVGYEAIRNERFKKQKKLGIVSEELKLSPAVYPDWESVENKEQEAREMAVYAAMVDCMDQNIGRLLKSLEDQGIEENTIVFFLSDNGAGMSDFNKTPEAEIGTRNSNATYGVWYNVGSTPYRKGKQLEHEGGIITPMIARWPVGIKNKGEIIHESAHITDFMPTCIELAGAKYPKIFNGNEIEPHDGKSFLPLISGEEQDKDRIYFWSFIGNKAIRQGDWKLVQLHEKDWELYNIKNDPTELNDLSKKEPVKFNELLTKYNDFAKEHGVRPWPLKKE